jgi:hypothetical protein
VISKFLAARLKTILLETISPTQSSFVHGRLIMDNVLVAFESYHTIKKKKEGKYGICAIKLDMHNAYDRVEWIFLKKILAQLRFHVTWIELIMSCVWALSSTK